MHLGTNTIFLHFLIAPKMRSKKHLGSISKKHPGSKKGCFFEIEGAEVQ